MKNINPNQKQVESQNKAILSYLARTKNGLTPLEALKKFGCFRLSARIFDLKERGHKIDTELVMREGKRVAKYTLKQLVW